MRSDLCERGMCVREGGVQEREMCGRGMCVEERCVWIGV